MNEAVQAISAQAKQELQRGSKRCIRTTRVAGICDTCGSRPETLHMPTKAHGWYCGLCCVACNAKEGRK